MEGLDKEDVEMAKKEVMIVTGAGQISMAIARRMGYGKKIVMGDKNLENAAAHSRRGCSACNNADGGTVAA